MNAFWVTAKASLASRLRFLQHLGLTACQLFARTIWVTITNQKGMQRSYGPFITWLTIVIQSDKGGLPMLQLKTRLVNWLWMPCRPQGLSRRGTRVVKPAGCGLTVREVAHLPPQPLTAFPSLSSTRICSCGTPDSSSPIPDSSWLFPQHRSHCVCCEQKQRCRKMIITCQQRSSWAVQLKGAGGNN